MERRTTARERKREIKTEKNIYRQREKEKGDRERAREGGKTDSQRE